MFHMCDCTGKHDSTKLVMRNTEFCLSGARARLLSSKLQVYKFMGRTSQLCGAADLKIIHIIQKGLKEFPVNTSLLLMDLFHPLPPYSLRGWGVCQKGILRGFEAMSEKVRVGGWGLGGGGL